MNLLKRFAPSPLEHMSRQCLDKAKVIMKLQDRTSVLIPIGSEWSDSNYQAGMMIRHVEGFRPNRESVQILVDAPRGATMEPHYHDNTETIMCVSGHVRCPVNGRELTPGKTWEIKPGILHAFEFLEDTILSVMWFPKFD